MCCGLCGKARDDAGENRYHIASHRTSSRARGRVYVDDIDTVCDDGVRRCGSENADCARVSSTSGCAVHSGVCEFNCSSGAADADVVRQDSIRRYANADFPSLEPVLQRYLAEEAIARVEGACVAAAGPVRDGVAVMTNLAWTIDAAQLTRATGAAHTAILNDLQAQGHATRGG